MKLGDLSLCVHCGKPIMWSTVKLGFDPEHNTESWKHEDGNYACRIGTGSVAAAAGHSSREETLEKALKFIASLWPDPDYCAELVPEWVGPNDGRMRADMLWYALNKAREALGLPTYPRPEHWDKKKVKVEEEP
jgi:hypothetical protein